MIHDMGLTRIFNHMHFAVQNSTSAEKDLGEQFLAKPQILPASKPYWYHSFLLPNSQVPTGGEKLSQLWRRLSRRQ